MVERFMLKNVVPGDFSNSSTRSLPDVDATQKTAYETRISNIKHAEVAVGYMKTACRTAVLA
jgi:hypothetical protein